MVSIGTQVDDVEWILTGQKDIQSPVRKKSFTMGAAFGSY